MINELILKEKSELAKRILEHDTPYSRSKNTILKFFDNGNDTISQEVIDKQLTNRLKHTSNDATLDDRNEKKNYW